MAGGSSQFSSPRGMRDFYPEDMRTRRVLFDTWRATARDFGFVEYDACVVETLGLLKRKAGEEIVNQIYAFEDKSGRELALRPEMTPTLARMVASRHGSLTLPIKWTTVAQCFRYERMTKGRKREHYQWNMDIVGEPSVLAEIEVVAAAVTSLERLGLNAGDFYVHVNSRRLIGEVLDGAGVPADLHPATFLALDKRGKISDDDICTLLAEANMPAETIQDVFRILNIESLDEVEAMVGADSAALQELRDFFRLAEMYGIADRVKFDIAVIRGLAYYTGIVFEAFDAAREFRAIFGGGRYDGLLSEIGGRDETAVGLGFGDVVVLELLSSLGRTPGSGELCGTAVGFMQDDQRDTAAKVATALRAKGEPVDLALASCKPKSFFSRADKAGRARAIFIGPDDVESGTVRIKNLAARTQEEVAIADL